MSTPASIPPATRQAKGVNLLGLAKLLRHLKVVQTVPGLLVEDRALLGGLIMPGAWYPFDAFVRILAATHLHVGQGKDEAAREMGRAHAAAMLNGPHAAYLHPGDVPKTLASLARIWPNYFNFGSLVFKQESAQAMHLAVHDYDDMGRPHGTLVAQGWVTRSMELAGGSSVQARIERAPWLGGGPLNASLTWR